MKRVVILGCYLLAGCDQTADQKAIAAAGLKDPSSAQFRNLRAANGNLCGEINGRNSFGAYAGFQRFVVVGSEPVILEPAGDAEASDYFGVVWSSRCGTS